ncbi:hypothetical protein SETIT_2G222300v2, partial [Setaria italica]
MVLKLIKKLKCELSSSSKHNSKRSKVIKNSDDGFTRFSAAAFSNVIDCLTPHQRAVTEGYGFGSLLLFSKCSVISLTKESVNLVLGLPLGPKPFPAGSSDGKTIVLSKFGKEHLPQVTFFANKIIKQAEMSDEDISVCFMVVSLSTFLCSNTSLIPSQKYFSVFEDIDNAKDYDWCGLVLCWLLDRVKVFNSVNSGVGSSKYRQCLGGCIYYLAVMYLDHIDFRQRQVKADIPRISVWKDSMIQFYSNLDKKSLGVYGHRPLLDYDSTYYAQYRVFRSAEVDVTLDEDFCKQLEEVAGCTIPHSLKVKISVLVQKHCLMSGLSINLDLTSLGNVPDDLKRLFTKILNYASNVSARTKDLVVELMKAIAETERNDSEDRVQSSPDIQIVGSRTLAENVHDMAQKADALYNGNSNNLKSSMKTPSVREFHVCPTNSFLDPEGFQSKDPIRGPRRLVVPSRFLADEFITQKNKYRVSKFEIDNYKAIYYLASSSSSSENAVLFGGVRCMFWSLGEYLKSGGCVNNFVIAAFCYHLFCKPKGQPNDSKRHYFSSNISLYFSIFYDDHWFLFIVDIKDSKFVFLDSYYTENDEYHVYVKEQMNMNCFTPVYLDSLNLMNMNFSLLTTHSLIHDSFDSGVFVMIFLEYWESPRSLLANLFEEKDIPNIRIKIANDLVFSHKNSGNKDLVITFGHK